MQDSAPRLLPSAELAGLLQDFARAPGNYLVRLGEPRQLHAQLDMIAGWAVGRLPDELVYRADELREAAVLFVLRACFAPANTHYQVLGLTSAQLTPEVLRVRYRALIRLTHPDMGVKGLPPDAAGVVNRANEVLSNPVLRQRYDDELSGRQHSTPAADANGSLAQIELTTTWGERWQSFLARYPRLLRMVPAMLGIVMVGTGAITWLASTGNDGRVLIVARSSEPLSRTSDDEQRPAKASLASRPGTADQSVGPPKDANALRPSLRPEPVNAATPPRRETVATSRDAKESRASDNEVDKPERTSGTQGKQPSAAARNDEDQAALAAARAMRAEAVRPAPTMLSNPPPAIPAPAPVTPVAAVAPSAPTPTAPPALPPLFQVAATAPQPVAAQTWSVDVPQAKSYLAEIVMSIERPSRARRNNGYLSDMNVKGSLLQPALQLMRRFPQMEVEHMNWNDSTRPGAMTVQGQVTVRARNPDTGEVRRVNFRLNAEFWGTREGTVMAALNLQGED